MTVVANYGLAEVLGIAVLVLFTGTLIRQRYFSSISRIPGPILASFGTLWQLREIYGGRFEDSIVELHRKYGHFVRISYNEVSIDHPEALSAVLAAPIRKGDFYKVFPIPNANYQNMMSVVEYKRHVLMRSNLAAGFTLTNTLKNEHFIDRTISLMEDRLTQLSMTGSPVHLSQWIHFLTWDILGEVTFSKRFGFLDEGRDINNAVKNTFALALYITIAAYAQFAHSFLLGNPILRWINFQPNEHSFNTCCAAVNERKQNTEARVDMMEQWMMMQAKHPERMADQELLGNAAANVAAGSDTVGAMIQSFFYFLMRNPVYFDRLRIEIDEAQARGELSPVVSYLEAQKLPFLQACIKETMRVNTSVPWNLPRVVPPEGLEVAGQHFKAGTVLSVNPHAIHYAPHLWGPNAAVFDPTRWLGLEDSALRSLERYLIPFGLGYNACPGRNVAQVEMSKICSTLTRDFDMRFADPSSPWRWHTLFVKVPSDWPVWLARRTPPTLDMKVEVRAEAMAEATAVLVEA